jgi:hypothetical protein
MLQHETDKELIRVVAGKGEWQKSLYVLGIGRKKTLKYILKMTESKQKISLGRCENILDDNIKINLYGRRRLERNDNVKCIGVDGRTILKRILNEGAQRIWKMLVMVEG